MSESWKTQEDFEVDLIRYANYQTHASQANVPVPKEILQYREFLAQMPKNKAPDVDVSQTYVISGRGRGGAAFRLVEPGRVVPPDPEDDKETIAILRKVNGFGYSNEVIEDIIKSKNSQDD